MCSVVTRRYHSKQDHFISPYQWVTWRFEGRSDSLDKKTDSSFCGSTLVESSETNFYLLSSKNKKWLKCHSWCVAIKMEMVRAEMSSHHISMKGLQNKVRKIYFKKKKTTQCSLPFKQTRQWDWAGRTFYIHRCFVEVECDQIQLWNVYDWFLTQRNRTDRFQTNGPYL